MRSYSNESIAVVRLSLISAALPAIRYHYHAYPKCLLANLGIATSTASLPGEPHTFVSKFDKSINGTLPTVLSGWKISGQPPSPIVGWALDGFPIYGPYDDQVRGLGYRNGPFFFLLLSSFFLVLPHHP